MTTTRQPKKPPLYNNHLKVVSNCNACELGSLSNKRIIYRGDPTCDVLFVGTAPDDTARLLGEPSVGQPGRLLDRIIKESFPRKIKVGFTNAICCVPTDTATKRLRVPSSKEITACNNHLLSLVEIVKPTRIVAVGGVAEKAIKKAKLNTTLIYAKIIHPLSILNQQELGELDYARTVYILKQLFK